MLFLILCFVAHFLADFTKLSTPKMLKAKAAFSSFTDINNLLIIGTHGLTHGFLMFVVSLLFNDFGMSLLFFLLHSVIHTVIDCGKPLLTNYLVSKEIKANDISNVWFWSVFGLDQLLHSITIICLIYLVQ